MFLNTQTTKLKKILAQFTLGLWTINLELMLPPIGDLTVMVAFFRDGS